MNPLVYYSYFLVLLFGFFVNGRSVVIAFLKTELALTDTEIGLIFTLGSFVTIFGNIAVGYIIETRGFKKLLIFATLISAGAALFYLFHISYIVLLISSIFLAIGLNIKTFSANSIIAVVCGVKRSKYMNYTHLFYCLGSLAGPIAMTKFHHLIPSLSHTTAAESWRYNFSLNFLFFAAALFLTFKYAFPEPEHKKHLSSTELKKILSCPETFFFTFILMTYCISEVSLSNWMVIYLNSRGETIESASFMLSLFFVMMTAGRFLGGKFVTYENTNKAVLLCYFSLVILTLAGFFGITVCLFISGLFYAIIFPTVVSKAYHEIEYKPHFSVGIVMAGLGTGFSLSQYILGKLNDLYSISFGLSIIVCSSIILSTFLYLIYLGFRQKRR